VSDFENQKNPNPVHEIEYSLITKNKSVYMFMCSKHARI